MSTMTGHDEEYEDDFYAEYFASDRLYMPVVHGNVLPPKTLGLGVRAGDATWFVVPPTRDTTPCTSRPEMVR